MQTGMSKSATGSGSAASTACSSASKAIPAPAYQRLAPGGSPGTTSACAWRGSGGVEPQVRGAHLSQLAAATPPAEGQRRVRASREDDLHAARQVLEDLLDLPVDRRIDDEVEVVDDERDVGAKRGELIDQRR